MHIKLLFILSTFYWSAMLLAGESISQTMPVKKGGVVNIYNERGAITIQGWEQEKIKVEGELDTQTETFIFKTLDTVTQIKIELQNAIRRGEGSNLRIFVPVDSQLLIDGSQSSVVVSQISNRVAIDTTIGSITTSNTSNKLKLKTISGQITISAAQGNVELSSVNGPIKLEAEAANLKVKTISGQIEIKNKAVIDEVFINSVSGNINYQGAIKSTSSIKLSNSIGKIDLVSLNSIFPSCKVSTGPGGKIDNKLNQELPMEALDQSLQLSLTAVAEDKLNKENDAINSPKLNSTKIDSATIINTAKNTRVESKADAQNKVEHLGSSVPSSTKSVCIIESDSGVISLQAD